MPFIRAIPRIQELQPEARIVIVGERQGVSYGLENGEWCDRFLAEIEGEYDPSRVHFVGRIDYSRFLTLLQLSKAHGLTIPSSSWSLLEAMSIGWVVGSSNRPVRKCCSMNTMGCWWTSSARSP